MTLKFSPQRSDASLAYQVEGDVLTVTHTPANGKGAAVDVFDFSAYPDGQLDVSTIETTLPVQPVLAAERTAGVLTVMLLHWYAHGETSDRAEEVH